MAEPELLSALYVPISLNCYSALELNKFSREFVFSHSQSCHFSLKFILAFVTVEIAPILVSDICNIHLLVMLRGDRHVI